MAEPQPEFEKLRDILVVPHDPQWSEQFAEEAQRIAAVLGQEIVAIHHIGSTAIPGIKAKPILDFLIEVQDMERLDQLNSQMIELGYEPRGENGIPGRRYFVKNTGARRTHQLHAFQTGHPDLARHLNFRDYMCTHPQDAHAYTRLKEELALKYPHDIDGYLDGKDAFIKEMDRRAKAWRESTTEETS